MAPALSRGSFALPHLGDWTQDGQPALQPHLSTTDAGRVKPRSGVLRAAKDKARPSGKAVVDEDRCAFGVRVSNSRHSTDIPTITRCEQGQQSDSCVLRRVNSPRQIFDTRFRHCAVREGPPHRLGVKGPFGKVEIVNRHQSPIEGSNLVGDRP